MEIAIKLAQFLLSLSLLIILHEFGHFLPAKIFRTRVEKFYLFFDVKFSLFKKKIGETVYGIGWLPLGGYVKIAGMIDESMDKEQMEQEPQPWEFRSKPTWQRLIIMLGGVTVNFILAILIYIGMSYFYGDTYIANNQVKDGIEVVKPVGKELGFETGDKIVSVDGKKYEKFDDIPYAILFSKQVTVERNGETKTITMPPDLISKVLEGSKDPFIVLRSPFVVGKFSDDSPNKDNLQKQDIVLSINGQQTKYYDQVVDFAQNHKGQTVDAVVLRDLKKQPVKITFNDEGKMGIFTGGLTSDAMEKLGYYHISHEKYGFLESFPAGLKRSKDEVGKYFTQLKAIFTPSTGAYKGVGGFYAIFDIFPNTWSWEAFWNITALLSIMLGVMNLLPIPALDGGHVMFLLFEMITGRKPSDKFMEYAQIAGFIIIIGLVLFANGNDIYKAVFGK